jgi:hypothetical protein
MLLASPWTASVSIKEFKSVIVDEAQHFWPLHSQVEKKRLQKETSTIRLNIPGLFLDRGQPR